MHPSNKCIDVKELLLRIQLRLASQLHQSSITVNSTRNIGQRMPPIALETPYPYQQPAPSLNAINPDQASMLMMMRHQESALRRQRAAYGLSSQQAQIRHVASHTPTPYVTLSGHLPLNNGALPPSVPLHSTASRASDLVARAEDGVRGSRKSRHPGLKESPNPSLPATSDTPKQAKKTKPKPYKKAQPKPGKKIQPKLAKPEEKAQPKLAKQEEKKPLKQQKKAQPKLAKQEEQEKTPKISKKSNEPTQRDANWMTSFKQLLDYKAEFGDCIVPRGYLSNPRLASWVAEQRKQYRLLEDGKQSSITPERIERLREVGFTWNAQCAAWDRQVADLKKYKDEYGDCIVPLGHPKHPKLGLWVKEQRRHYNLMMQGKPSHMTKERQEILEGIGFLWDTHHAVWDMRFQQLSAYKDKHGDCNVPINNGKQNGNPKIFKLGAWVHYQRRQFKKYKAGERSNMTLERLRLLNKIGLSWDRPQRGAKRSRPNSTVGDDEDSSSDAFSRGTSSFDESFDDTDNDEEELRPLPKRRRIATHSA